ncbi:histidine phosphatase family protein [Streptomyces sp. NPDC041068]|uniref:histidine phosphatase family protein n=1 Tax=Streptomyces sp. NPDC041068 TaxID=3155130 RepID=UPI0033C4F308
MAIEIVYETHATTTDNEAGIATGWLPGRLSSAGRGQARELGERRRDDGITAVVTSDLQRAVDTARIAFADSTVPVSHDRRLRECDYALEQRGKAAAASDRHDVVAFAARYLRRPLPARPGSRAASISMWSSPSTSCTCPPDWP